MAAKKFQEFHGADAIQSVGSDKSEIRENELSLLCQDNVAGEA